MISPKQTSALFFLFNDAINNTREEELASTCNISCSGSQAPPIPRRTILWNELQTSLVFLPDYSRCVFDSK